MNNNDNDSENKDINDDENEEELELGVLAGLTINNEADPLGLSDNSYISQFRRSWTHKYTLRSHLDGVRCVQFHPVEPLLVSASEDKVVKVWNLNRTVAGKKTQTADIDPIMNYRGHDEPVLSVVFGENEIYSSGLDGQIFGWPIPKLDADLYDPFDSEILGRKFEGHTDAVWNLDFQEQSLVSSSADGKIIVWDIPTGTPAITITAESLGMPELGIPVDARWSSEANKLVAIWKGDKITTIDVTTGKIVLMLDECVEANAVCTHPLVPIAVTAHEDKHIRMWDLSSGILVHTCSAHADAVSTVAIDKTGAYLLTGGHDSSIRLWNIDTKVCVQEMTAHRPKNDEAVHYATFHINKGYVASAGADGLVKIFV
ncbi:unnamed protein product [Oikopleura dioica]|nr:unnamed protein product [Oikopleura dioica]